MKYVLAYRFSCYDYQPDTYGFVKLHANCLANAVQETDLYYNAEIMRDVYIMQNSGEPVTIEDGVTAQSYVAVLKKCNGTWSETNTDYAVKYYVCNGTDWFC